MEPSSRQRQMPRRLIALLTLILALALPGTAQAKHGRDLTVMTQNLYLGSSLAPVLSATTPAEFISGVAQIYGTVLFTNFPARANAIADEIAASRPDLIGLQEVTNWTTTRLTPGTVPPSFDFLAILQPALDARGLHYDAAAVSNNASAGPLPLVSPPFGCLTVSPVPDCMVTFQDRDAILVSRDNPSLTTGNPQVGHYAAQEVLTTPVGPLSFARGWASIDGTLDRRAFHFVTTHLEIGDFPSIQQAQAQEFLAGPARAIGSVIAVGDFNSAADGSTTTSYADLTKHYLHDSWALNPDNPGSSCCQSGTLTNPTSALTSRIDLVLTHGASPRRKAPPYLVGTSPFEVTAPLWASDHAGLIATLRLHRRAGSAASALARASDAGCARGGETHMEAPNGLRQSGEVGRPRIPVGGKARSKIMLQGDAYAVDRHASVTLEIEVAAVDAPFRQIDAVRSSPIACGGTATIVLRQLSFGPYHWRARAVDSDMHASRWHSFGSNPEAAVDFWLTR